MMNRYAIYSTATGEILRIVQCLGAHALAQLGAGEALLPCPEGVTDETHRVEAGALVPIPEE